MPTILNHRQVAALSSLHMFAELRRERHEGPSAEWLRKASDNAVRSAALSCFRAGISREQVEYIVDQA